MEISPEDAETVKGRAYTVKKFGAYYYTNAEDTTTTT